MDAEIALLVPGALGLKMPSMVTSSTKTCAAIVIIAASTVGSAARRVQQRDRASVGMPDEHGALDPGSVEHFGDHRRLFLQVVRAAVGGVIRIGAAEPARPPQEHASSGGLREPAPGSRFHSPTHPSPSCSSTKVGAGTVRFRLRLATASYTPGGGGASPGRRKRGRSLTSSERLGGGKRDLRPRRLGPWCLARSGRSPSPGWRESRSKPYPRSEPEDGKGAPPLL